MKIKTDRDLMLLLIDAVAPLFGIPPDQIKRRSRFRPEVDARHAIFSYLHEVKGWGPTRTLRAFPVSFDHSTIIHGVNISARICDVDSDYKERRRQAFSAMDLVFNVTRCEPTPPIENIYLTTNEAQNERQ